VCTTYQKDKKIKIGGISLDYRDDWDILGMVEIYALNIYHIEMIKRGDTVLDLGAGIGDFSACASKRVGKSGRVIAIEPNKDDFEFLMKNMKSNRCDNVIALNYGVADKEGKLKREFKGQTFEFQAKTLDNILKETDTPKFDFAKIDIEGAEVVALQEFTSLEISSMDSINLIAIEMHGTKELIDQIFVPRGFVFLRLTKREYLT
jgi:FkbM family methyltransferase